MTQPLLVALAIVILLAIFVTYWLTTKGARRLRASAKLGARAEHKGYKMLEKAGYTILSRQLAGEIMLDVDGSIRSFPVRADGLVSWRGKQAVAEIKGGANASLESRHTRRQLIEYAIAFDVDVVVLVDVPKNKIHRIRIPRQRSSVA